MDRFETPVTGRQAGEREGAGRLTIGFLREPGAARRGMVAGAVVTGFGLIGFLDGILLHQLLQWHHMVAAWVPPTTLRAMEVNTFADGLFSLAMWTATVVGFGLLWRGLRREPGAVLPTRSLLGWLLIGGGGFHFFDSLVFHALLGLHHIRQVEGFLPYDLGFFVVGVILVGVGVFLVREPKPLLRE